MQASPSPSPVPRPAPEQAVFPRQQVGGSPRAVYQAVRAKREVLSDQMNRLLNRRNNVSERLNQPDVGPAEKVALEQHIQELNTRIIDMEKTLHAADAEVAAAAGVPGATVADSRGGGYDGPPEEMLIIGTVFSGIALVIVAFAYARRLWKGATKVVSQIPAAFEARLTRFEQSLDAVAIEIERVSEGQRFLTKLLAEDDPRAIGAGPAQPVETRAGVAEPIRRT
ncbi:MAG: hypothetical protein M3303_00675 [Gemmatimonadota bacterium]|nr:hypothetical protein [Gemmatimonadota bacterium]